MIKLTRNRNTYGIAKSSIRRGATVEWKSGSNVRTGVVQRVEGKAVIMDGNRQTHWQNVTEVRWMQRVTDGKQATARRATGGTVTGQIVGKTGTHVEIETSAPRGGTGEGEKLCVVWRKVVSVGGETWTLSTDQ